jgi:hypothetical protein
MRLRVLSLTVVILRSRATVMSLMISSISAVSGLLGSSIEILPGASVLRHIEGVFNARRPLTLGISH